MLPTCHAVQHLSHFHSCVIVLSGHHIFTLQGSCIGLGGSNQVPLGHCRRIGKKLIARMPLILALAESIDALVVDGCTFSSLSTFFIPIGLGSLLCCAGLLLFMFVLLRLPGVLTAAALL